MNRPDAGGWSAKDNLAHLSAWMRFMLLHYLQGRPAHEAMGIDQATMERLDEDGENALLFERNRNRSSADVMAELSQTFEHVRATLLEMDFADLMKPRFPDDPEKRSLLQGVIGNTYEHYQEQRKAIEAAVVSVR